MVNKNLSDNPRTRNYRLKSKLRRRTRGARVSRKRNMVRKQTGGANTNTYEGTMDASARIRSLKKVQSEAFNIKKSKTELDNDKYTEIITELKRILPLVKTQFDDDDDQKDELIGKLERRIIVVTRVQHNTNQEHSEEELKIKYTDFTTTEQKIETITFIVDNKNPSLYKKFTTLKENLEKLLGQKPPSIVKEEKEEEGDTENLFSDFVFSNMMNNNGDEALFSFHNNVIKNSEIKDTLYESLKIDNKGNLKEIGDGSHSKEFRESKIILNDEDEFLSNLFDVPKTKGIFEQFFKEQEQNFIKLHELWLKENKPKLPGYEPPPGFDNEEGELTNLKEDLKKKYIKMVRHFIFGLII